MDGITKTRRVMNWKRGARPAEALANANALAAARYLMETPANRMEVCKEFNTNSGSLTNALVLLQEGTPEEIAGVEAGGALYPIAKMIIARRAPTSGKRRRLKKVGFSQEALARKKVEMAIWESLGSALKNIASLPQPQDVVEIARKNTMRVQAVDRNLMTAFTWITEFSDAWTK